MKMSLVLASTSPFRKMILENAGIAVETAAPQIGEREAEKPLLDAGADAQDVAEVLAEAKALDVSARFPGRLVLGGDQTLDLDGELVHKAKDMEEARRRLLSMSGKTHTLNSAMVLVRDGQTIWRHVAVAHMKMRAFTPEETGRYLAEAGDGILKSVGLYQIEGPGIRLFEKVEGDYFTIIGVPLMPLMAKLRELGEIDF